jgi:hypothetical protein
MNIAPYVAVRSTITGGGGFEEAMREEIQYATPDRWRCI